MTRPTPNPENVYRIHINGKESRTLQETTARGAKALCANIVDLWSKQNKTGVVCVVYRGSVVHTHQTPEQHSE